MFIVKWRNKFSGEEGYVARISKKKGHFYNSWDQAGSKSYRTVKAAESDIATLNGIGEGVNNEFFVVEQ